MNLASNLIRARKSIGRDHGFGEEYSSPSRSRADGVDRWIFVLLSSYSLGSHSTLWPSEYRATGPIITPSKSCRWILNRYHTIDLARLGPVNCNLARSMEWYRFRIHLNDFEGVIIGPVARYSLGQSVLCEPSEKSDTGPMIPQSTQSAREIGSGSTNEPNWWCRSMDFRALTKLLARFTKHTLT